MKWDSYARSAMEVIANYGGDLPLPVFLKDYFRQNKQMGSTDRRTISSLIYNYYRLGHAPHYVQPTERMQLGNFLCNQQPNDWLQYFKPEWNALMKADLEEKIAVADSNFSITNIFPWADELSEGMDHAAFCRSFLVQPDLFLRLRPGFEKKTAQQLHDAAIPFEKVTETCLRLPNSTKLEGVIETDKQAVVQDMNSQTVGNYLQPVMQQVKTVWDCCAASGGKSLMAYDLNTGIKLTVSDIRNTIIQNLQNRFAKAGIKSFTSFIVDLSKPKQENILPVKPFDLVMADVPCTGSGTWARTPEQLVFFHPESIAAFSEKQKSIVRTAVPLVKPGGYFLYITCSVFKQENEAVVVFIEKECGLQLESRELLKGYDKRADTLFVARFVKK
jgi:16S rRNA (cytosine967-C5)-methyltransferase